MPRIRPKGKEHVEKRPCKTHICDAILNIKQMRGPKRGEKMDLFSIEYQEHVRKMRKKFFETGSTEGITGVRPEILDCWKAAFLSKISLDNAKKEVVSPAAFAAALKNSAELLEVAEPYMQLLNSFLEPDSFWVGLMDYSGVILRLVGSPAMLKLARSTELVEGSYRGSNMSYPGMYNTCLKVDRPFRLVSGEHPSRVDDGMAGAAAPIHDRRTGKALGVIGISGYWEKSHGHTMGLSIMAAEAIAQEMELRKVLRESNLSEKPCENEDGGRKKHGGANADLAYPEEAKELLEILRQYQGNVSEAARVMGVSRPTVYRKLKKYGINPMEKWLFI